MSMRTTLAVFAKGIFKTPYSSFATAAGTDLVPLISAVDGRTIGYVTAAQVQNLGITAGTGAASRALVLGASGEISIPGILSPLGGVNDISGSPGAFTKYLIHTGGMPARISTDGTDATPSVTETYLSLLYVPFNQTVTGISIFNGSATGSGSVTAYLGSVGGAAISTAFSASTAIVGTDAYQRLPFSGGAITVIGPRAYFVLTQYNNTGSRFNTHVFGDFPAGKLTSTVYGTFPASFTAPTTFTTGLGPIASLY